MIRPPLVVMMFLLMLGTAVTAADRTWTGAAGAGSPDWTLAINWGGVAPMGGDALIFPSVTQKNGTNGFTAGTAFGPLTINAGGYVLSGNSITLNGGIFLNGANTAQLALPFQVSTPQAFNVSHASGVLTLTQAITGAGGVIKSGSGLLIFTGNQAYIGPTIISGGGLQIGGTLTGPAQISTGFLSGTGTAQGITALQQGVASISPGTNGAAGTLTSNGNVTLYTGDQLYFDVLNGSNDKLAVTGTVNLGKAGLNFSLQSGYTPPLNTDIVLIENDGTDPLVYDATTPSNFLYSVTLNSLPFRVLTVGGTNRNDLVLRHVATGTSTVTLSSSDTTTAFGDAVDFDVLVTGLVNGSTVSFWDGAEFIGSSVITGAQAKLANVTTLKPGNHSITALFEGSGTHAPARSSILIQQVSGVSTTTDLIVSPTPSSAPGVLVTLNASINATSPTGTVTFLDAGAELGTVTVAGGQAVFTTSTLLSGGHSFTARFNPTGAFLGSVSSAKAHTVSGTTTTTTLITSANPLVAGNEVMFQAAVTAGATGQVTFMDGAATLGTRTLSAGTASFTTSGLAAGTHSIKAVYQGTTAFSPSSSSVLAQVITARPGGGGSSGTPDEAGGGCGLGSGLATLALGLFLLMGLRLRRN